jgi:hypothetical protein
LEDDMPDIFPRDFDKPARDGKPVAVMDWPEAGSPVPRLTLSINEGLLLIRCNEAMRQLVLSTAEPATRP